MNPAPEYSGNPRIDALLYAALIAGKCRCPECGAIEVHEFYTDGPMRGSAKADTVVMHCGRAMHLMPA